MATELLGEFNQGAFELVKETKTPGANAWDFPVVVQTYTPLSGVAKRIHRRYQGGILVIETGDEIMFAVPPVAFEITDKIRIDGKVRSFTDLQPIPSAGEPVAWKAFVAL